MAKFKVVVELGSGVLRHEYGYTVEFEANFNPQNDEVFRGTHLDVAIAARMAEVDAIREHKVPNPHAVSVTALNDDGTDQVDLSVWLKSRR